MNATMINRPTMTEYNAAVARAAKRGVAVQARGVRKADGATAYFVNSGRATSRWHMVVVEGKRLVCDCESRVYCCHRAAVHEHLVAERAAVQMTVVAAAATVAAQAVKPTPVVTPRTDAERASAPLFRSNAPFSLFK